MMSKFKLAKGKSSVTCILAYELLSSHITLCKAYKRAEKWDNVVEVVNNASENAKDINWDDNNGAHASFLYVDLVDILSWTSP